MEVKNFEVDAKKQFVKIFVNTTLFPLSVVQSAAYAFIDRAYVQLEGDPNTEIVVTMKPKDSKKANLKDLEIMAREFNNELINFAVYEMQARRNLRLREMLLRRAVETTTQQTLPPQQTLQPQLQQPQPTQPMREGRRREGI